MTAEPAPAAAHVTVASAGDVQADLADGLDAEAVGVLAGRPVLAVAVDGDPALGRVADLAATLPCVVVGVAEGSRLPASAPHFDILLADHPDPPPPWVSSPGLGGGLAQVAEAVLRNPLAAVTLVQLLRLSSGLPVQQAVVAESLAYSVLQSGPEFERWLAGRPPTRRAPDDAPAVAVERDGAVLKLRLNRPAVRNAFSARMRDDLVAALQVAAADATVASVRLTGAGPAFCSGGDLAEFGSRPDAVSAHAVRTTRSPAMWMITCAPRTTVFLHGACVGAGIELPAFAGRVVAAPDTVCRLPEVGMGLIPGAGGTASIPRRAGRHRTAWMALTGAPVDAATAVGWGLVDEIAARQ